MSTLFSIDPAALPSFSDLETAKHGQSDLLARLEAETDTLPDLKSATLSFIETDVGKALIDTLFAHSPFLGQCLLREPTWLGILAQDGVDQAVEHVISDTRNETAKLTDEAAIMRALRIAKRRIALTIAIADIAGLWTLDQVTGALSDFADAATEAAACYVIRRAVARGALRIKDEDNPQLGSGFIVIGMGKLGAHELNYSSDIDLICLYDNDVMDTDDKIGLQQHVIRMTRTLARILDERTADGYVFRVDLRLRPDPGSTPLAISVLAAETYYESLGQNWERAAMIKARVIAGDKVAGNMFLKNLRPFVWRKSLDFAAIQDIHSIKRQIHAHKGGGEIAVNAHNIKTGRGGIREIEFFAQTQQLIWGGRELALRTPRTMDAIVGLVDLEQVDSKAAKELEEAYIFLRTVEHRLQMQRDEQTQTLPGDDEGIAKLGEFCGFEDADAFRRKLLHVLGTVRDHYGALFEDSPSLAGDDDTEGNLSFTGVESDPNTLDTLARYGFSDGATIDKMIRAWHHGRIRATRSTRARELLTELTPTLLRAIGSQSNPDATFLRFDSFISALPSGVQLFSMFQAYPDLLNLLAEIMGKAPRLSQILSRRPNLLDSVLSADFYDPLPDVEELAADCKRALTDSVFFEDALDATRRWNSDRRFQIGVQLLRGVVSPSNAARHFSDVAEAVLQTLFPEVIKEFEERHGQIPGGGLSVLALGKLGSRELTPSSDLDLIFVYNAEEQNVVSDGEKALPASQYYSRLGQRMINSIMSMTAEGTLYEIDMRLRPSGNKGPVSTSLDSFVKYYDETAWTWEYMALTRARVVFDVGGLGDTLTKTVRSIVAKERDPTSTANDVAHMRGRIEKQHGTSCIWAIKQVPGGQVDVDFIAQYLVLAHAASHPDIMKPEAEKVFRKALEIGAIDDNDYETLFQAKTMYRDLQTFLALTIEGEMTDEKASGFSVPLKKDLMRLTNNDTFEDVVEHLNDRETRVREVFVDCLGDPLQSEDNTAPNPD